MAQGPNMQGPNMQGGPNPWQQGPVMPQQGPGPMQNMPPMNPNWQGGPPMPPFPPNSMFGPQGVPPKKNNTGRNVGIGIGSLAVVGLVVAAIALSGGKKNDTVTNTDNSLHTSSPVVPTSSQAPTTDAPTTDAPTTSDTTTSNPPTDTSSAFDPTTLDEQNTDQTPQTADALLPPSFTDSKGVQYDIKSSGTENCVNSYETSHVQDILKGHNCVNAAVGTYVDKSNQVLIAVQIMALGDKREAVDAYTGLSSTNDHSNDWGIWCPKDGPGSQICNNNEDISGATQSGYIEQTHRYLIHTLALYINLTQDTSVKPWVQAAAQKAADSTGPQNYSGNQ
jgi:hypothetical protein